jgi:UDP-N-acetylglucosamine 4,6-dehydratase
VEKETVTSALAGKTVMLTGGTGSFGNRFVEMALSDGDPAKLIVFSRDELKQWEMQQRFPDARLRFFIGDVRDKTRLERAMQGVDIVIHAAALKQVPTAEYNPLEVIKTNVMGAANVIDAALDQGVNRVVALSTDKAANPINLYGATKLCSDKLFVAANSYAGRQPTRFSVVRYGNVIGSRGSVVPVFRERRRTGRFEITDVRMTRFWITLDQGVRFVMRCLGTMQGGEVFVPKLPSVKIIDVAAAIGPDCAIDVVGIRPGEKLHETMVPVDDARNTLEYEDCFVIQPPFPWWDANYYMSRNGGKPCADGFSYSSDTNTHHLSIDELRELLDACHPQ